MAADHPIVRKSLEDMREHIVAERDLVLACAPGRDPTLLRRGLRDEYEHLQSLIRQADRALAAIAGANEP